MGMNAEELGRYIAEHLNRLNMTQKELAKKTGLHKDVINKAVNGRPGVGANARSRIAQALGIIIPNDPPYFMPSDEDKEENKR